MWLRVASWGQLPARRNSWSPHLQLMFSIFFITRRTSFVCGSLAAANLNSSRSDLRAWIPRALSIVNTLGQLSTTIPIGFRLNSRPVAGTLLFFFAGGCLDWSRAERPSVSWTKVSKTLHWYGWHLTFGQCGGVLHGGREHLRGWEGRVCFTWFHLVCKFPWLFAWLSPWLVCVCVCCFCCLFGWVGCWFLSLGKFVFNYRLTPVVDRPSLALVRQCRKKKKVSKTLWSNPPSWLDVNLWQFMTKTCKKANLKNKKLHTKRKRKRVGTKGPYSFAWRSCWINSAGAIGRWSCRHYPKHRLPHIWYAVLSIASVVGWCTMSLICAPVSPKSPACKFTFVGGNFSQQIVINHLCILFDWLIILVPFAVPWSCLDLSSALESVTDYYTFGCPLQYFGSGSCQVTVVLPHASVHLWDYRWWKVAYRAWHHRLASE